MRNNRPAIIAEWVWQKEKDLSNIGVETGGEGGGGGAPGPPSPTML